MPKLHVFATGVLTVASVAAMAAGPLEVTSRVLVEHHMRAADGSTKTTLVAANKVAPGRRVVFVLDYRNTGRSPLANVVIDNPVPSAIAYRGADADSPAPDVSVDGRTYGALAGLTVRGIDGASRPARADDVTHVRWRLASPLAAGAQGRFSFHAAVK